ncbi:MAG: HGGxSTG domain-containing protein [Hyphomicrobium sp.]
MGFQRIEGKRRKSNVRLYKITYNARTRAGHPCKRKALANGRCPNHGGLSTGPRTKAGRARCAAATHQRWARWREQRAQTSAI